MTRLQAPVLSCSDACLQGRQVSVRRRLRGEQLGMRYASLDASMLRREAIRGMLKPGAKPASQLGTLAVFAGGAFLPLVLSMQLVYPSPSCSATMTSAVSVMCRALPKRNSASLSRSPFCLQVLLVWRCSDNDLF